MKTVFPSSELCHIWAAQKQESGRSQASIFFEGTRIYSYGRHFCIADIIKPNVVLFTTRRYSVTTSKHISCVSSACSHMERIYCAYPSGSLLDNLTAWQNEIKSLLDDLANPRKRPQTKDAIRGSLAHVVEQVNKYLSTTGKKLSKKLHAEFIAYLEAATDQQAAEKLMIKLERAEKLKAKKLAAKQAEERAIAMQELLKWRSGKKNKHRTYLDLPVYLRVSNKQKIDNVGITENFTKEIETSKGARVSYQAGRVLFNRIKLGYDVKGFNIDGYTVISVNGTLKIGCHEIDMKEVKRFAKKEGW